jgi:hypothetical protein
MYYFPFVVHDNGGILDEGAVCRLDPRVEHSPDAELPAFVAHFLHLRAVQRNADRGPYARGITLKAALGAHKQVKPGKAAAALSIHSRI